MKRHQSVSDLRTLMGISAAIVIWSLVGGRSVIDRERGEQALRAVSGARSSESEAVLPRSYHLATSVSLDRLPGEQLLPTDVALGPEGTLYVTDFTSHNVVVFNADGTERERWRHQLAALGCGGVFVPVALDTTSGGDVAILWHLFPLRDGQPQSDRLASFVEIRAQDGNVKSIFRVGVEYTDLVLFDDQVYLVQPSTINVSSMAGAIDSDRRLLITAIRRQAGSFDLMAADRVAAIKQNGTVHIQTVNPYTDKMIDIGNLHPLAIDAVGATLHIVAVDDARMTIHHLRVDAFGRQLSDAPLTGVPYYQGVVGGWPLSVAAQVQGMSVITAGVNGLIVIRVDAMDQLVVSVQAGLPTGAQLDQPSRRGWTACGDGSMSLGTASEDGILVYDHEEQRFIAYDSQLILLSTYSVSTPLVSVDATGPAASDLVMVTATDRLIRSNADGPGAPRWDVPCNCRGLGRLAWSAGHLTVARRADKRVRWHDDATGQPGREVAGISESELWPFDVAVYPDGEMVATDLIEKRLQHFAADGTQLGDVVAGFAVGPQFVAVVDQPVVGRVVVTAMWDGQLELRELENGNLLVRWPAEENGVPIRVADVGVDAQLRVYVLDARKRVLYRFDPRPDALPTVQATPTPSRTTCVVQGDKRAGPATVVLGSTASITLTFRADCPMAETGVGADIVLVADNSSSMSPVADILHKALTDFGNSVDLKRNRIGLVVFRHEATIVSPLSHVQRDFGALLGDAQQMAGDGSSIYAGLAKARDHLLTAGDSSAIPIVILMSDGGSYGEINGIEAQRTKDAGIQIFVVAIGSPPAHSVLRPLASSPAHYFATWTPDDLFLIFRQLAHQITASRIGNLVINDELSADVDYVADSSFPPASVGSGRVTWGRGILPSTGITVSLQVSPLRAGRHIPTNRQAIAEYTDADGTVRQFMFPVPYIDVITPTATPTVTPTATVTRTPAPANAYLPVALHEAPCRPELWPLDVMLVIDSSNSMSGGKLTAAQGAARAFVSMLHLGKDRIGLATFSTDARLGIGLTTDGPQFVAAVDRIALSAGTRMDSGLSLALGTMLGSPRPEAKRAVVLLTDGRQDAEPQSALDAAAALRRAGIDLLAVGLGADADLAFLEELVDDKRKVRRAGDAATLAEVYRQLARELPCDRAMWWAGR